MENKIVYREMWHLESVARCIYPVYSVAVLNKSIKTVNQMSNNFIWKAFDF